MGVLKDVNPHFLFRLQALACLSAHTRVRPSARATTKQVGRLISFSRARRGPARSGMVWSDVARRGWARRGLAWSGRSWRGAARYGKEHRCLAATNCKANRGSAGLGAARPSGARHGVVGLGPVGARYGTAWPGTARLREVRHGTARIPAQQRTR